MSDRTHQYRLLTRRDPAITTQVYGVDPATGETHPLASTADGKLVVEVSGGGGGGSQIIQGVDSGGTAHDVLVETDGKLIVDVASAPVIKAEGPSGPLELGATVDARLTVQVQDDATVAMRAVGPSGITDVQMSADGLLVDVSPGVVIPVDSPTGLLVKGVDAAAAEYPILVTSQGSAIVTATNANGYAITDATGPIVFAGFSDALGWIDLRAFSRFSAFGNATGTVNAPGGPYTLGFNGNVQLQYKLHEFDPTPQDLGPSHHIHTAYHHLIDPEAPADILGIAYIRFVVESNAGGGLGSFFWMAK